MVACVASLGWAMALTRKLVRWDTRPVPSRLRSDARNSIGARSRAIGMNDLEALHPVRPYPRRPLEDQPRAVHRSGPSPPRSRLAGRGLLGARDRGHLLLPVLCLLGGMRPRPVDPGH